MPKTIIVGGGLAGLATAVKLLDAGIEVELIEKRDVLGGKTSSWQDDAGDHIESGLHCYFRCYKSCCHSFSMLASINTFVGRSTVSGSRGRMESTRGCTSPSCPHR